MYMMRKGQAESLRRSPVRFGVQWLKELFDYIIFYNKPITYRRTSGDYSAANKGHCKGTGRIPATVVENEPTKYRQSIELRRQMLPNNSAPHHPLRPMHFLS